MRTFKVLVTGGAGYIGSVAVRILLDAGYSVVVFDNLYQGHVEAVDPRAAFVQGDLSRLEDIRALFAAHPDIQAIMHFASYTLVGESMHQPLKYLRDNVANAANLLEIAVQHNVQRFILSSTANLFDLPADRASEPIDEHFPVRPGSPYGESKYAIERMLTWMHRIYGLRYACLRYFNACGALDDLGEDHDPETHLIPLVLQVALGKRPHILIFGDDYPTRDGTCVRDYIHVADLAQAHLLALEGLERFEVRHYNLGNETGYTVKEVIEVARRVTGHPIPAVIGPRRPGDPATLVASSAAIRRDLGWQPRYRDLETIIRTAWEWHRTHPDGYRSRALSSRSSPSNPGRDVCLPQ